MNQPGNKIFHQNRLPNLIGPDQSYGTLSEKIPEDFLNYLTQMGLLVDSGVLVIPYQNHYFYDFEEMRGVKTIINPMKLNHIREVKGFIQRLSELLHYQAIFTGCFVDNKTLNPFSVKYNIASRKHSDMTEYYENGIESRIPFVNRMYSFIDSKTNRHMTKKTVASLLNEFGFLVVGMTEMNGVTYFYSRKESLIA